MSELMDMGAKALLVIGGLNWGLVGLADMNLVTMLFGSIPILVTGVYGLIGLSALFFGYEEFLKK